MRTLEADYQQRAALTPISVETFLDWMPAVSKAMFQTCRIVPASLKVPIKCCYAWRMRVRDKRQRHMVGDDDVVTGVRVWPLLVPGIKCDPTIAGLLVKVNTKEQDEGEEDMDEEDAEEVAVACASDLGMLVDQYMGWRTSYRRGRPEDYHQGEARVRRVLKSKAKQLAKSGLP